SGPPSSGSFALTLIRRSPQRTMCGLLGVLPRITRISARAQPSLTSQLCVVSAIANKKALLFYVQ
ncbi:hypothetical protein C6379_02070, partial [Pseudomonas syringae pv. actinidiae]